MSTGSNKRLSLQWYLDLKPIEPWAVCRQAFSQQECQKIKEQAGYLSRNQGQIGTATDLREDSIDREMRSSIVSFFDSEQADTQWIFRKVTDIITTMNRQFWQFDLDYIECLQYTEYASPSDHYDRHIDMILDGFHYRKLSFSLQLSDTDDYQGGELMIDFSGTESPASREQGTLIAFPSFIPHRVTEVSQGLRQSLVGWVCGPKFK